MTDLQNEMVLVTRPEPQATLLCEQIVALGAKAFAFPTIAFAPPPNEKKFHQEIMLLDEQEYLIFISPQAVAASINAIKQAWPQLPSHLKIAAVGAGTARALTNAGLSVDLQPNSEWSSQGLLDLPEFQKIENRKIAIIRGVGGRELLDTMLAERGAQVLPIIAYERVLPVIDNRDCLSLLQQGKITIIVCTSFESVSNLKILLGDAWPHVLHLPLIVMSERVKLLAQGLGFQTIWVTPEASQAAILDLIVHRRKE